MVSDADDAFIPAYRWAERTGAKLHIVYVEVLHGDVLDAVAAKTQAMTKEALAGRTSSENGPPSVEIKHTVLRDVAAGPALLAYAAEHDIDLIVMGTHGRSGLAKLFMGSIAEGVSENAGCEVVTIKMNGDQVEA